MASNKRHFKEFAPAAKLTKEKAPTVSIKTPVAVQKKLAAKLLSKAPVGKLAPFPFPTFASIEAAKVKQVEVEEIESRADIALRMVIDHLAFIYKMDNGSGRLRMYKVRDKSYPDSYANNAMWFSAPEYRDKSYDDLYVKHNGMLLSASEYRQVRVSRHVVECEPPFGRVTLLSINDEAAKKWKRTVPDEAPVDVPARVQPSRQFKDLALMQVFSFMSLGETLTAIKVGNSTAIAQIDLTDNRDIVNGCKLPIKLRVKRTTSVTLISRMMA